MHNDLKHAVSGSKYRTNNHYFHSEKVFHVRLKWHQKYEESETATVTLEMFHFFLNLTSWLFWIDHLNPLCLMLKTELNYEQSACICVALHGAEKLSLVKNSVTLYDALMNKVSISWLRTSCVFCICTQINKTNIFTTMADLTIFPWNHKWPVIYRDTQDSAFPEILIPRLRLCTQLHQTHIANSWLSVPNI